MLKLLKVPTATVALFLIALQSCLYFHDVTSRPSAEKVFDDTARSIVIIECIQGKSFGTTAGFVATDRGHIITVAHGLTACTGAKQKNIIVRFFDDPEVGHSATLVRFSKLNDVAVLKVADAPVDVPPLVINTDKHHPGEPAFIIGHAQLFYWGMMQGIVSADRILGNPMVHWIQIDAGVVEGNSGGPVLNKDSQVIGIGQFYVGGHAVMGFAIAGDVLKMYLRGL